MTQTKIAHPEIEPTDDLSETLEALTEEYGAVFSEYNRREVSFVYSEWVEPLRTFYPITDYKPLLDAFEKYHTPKSIDQDPEDVQMTIEDHFEGCFVRIAASDMILDAYSRGTLEDVPSDVFYELYDTPDDQPSPTSAAICLGALGALHSDVQYMEDVLQSGALDDFAALFSQMQLIWVVNPSLANTYYEQILTDGLNMLDEMERHGGDAAKDDPYAAFAGSFAAAILAYPDSPLGFGDYTFACHETITNTADYPPSDAAYQTLAELTANHISLENMHRSGRNTVRKYTR